MRRTRINPDGDWETTLRGREVFSDARINKGTAFSGEERRALVLWEFRSRILEAHAAA